MLMHNKFYCLAAAGIVLAALPVWAGSPSKTAPKAIPAETATIENSGSTNTTGYQIIVASNGSASYREAANGASPPEQPKPRVQALSKSTISKLFADLAAAGPLASLPARHGMRSVSFGTETYVTYKGQRSPDLTFPASPQAQAVHDDVMAITRTLHVANQPRFPLSRPILP